MKNGERHGSLTGYLGELAQDARNGSVRWKDQKGGNEMTGGHHGGMKCAGAQREILFLQDMRDGITQLPLSSLPPRLRLTHYRLSLHFMHELCNFHPGLTRHTSSIPSLCTLKTHHYQMKKPMRYSMLSRNNLALTCTYCLFLYRHPLHLLSLCHSQCLDFRAPTFLTHLQ